MEKLTNKLKTNIIKKLTNNKQILSEKYIVIGDKSYTRQDIANEIQNETEI